MKRNFFLPWFLMVISFFLVLSSSCSQGKDDHILQIPSREDPNILLQVEFLSPEIFNVRYGEREMIETENSLIINSFEKLSFPVRSHTSDQYHILETDILKVYIDKEDHQIIVKNEKDEVLLTESDEQNRKLMPVVLEGDSGYSIKQSFLFNDKEALYGLGQHQNGIMNYRNDTVELRQHNMEAVVPFLISSHGYGILWDNYSYTRFESKGNMGTFYSELGDMVNYYVCYGLEPDQVISGYRYLTGKVPMLPKWAFGYIQSKERYKDQKEILRVAERFRDENIPIDVIVQDWQYWEPGKWGDKNYDRIRFPNPAAMIDSLQNHYHLKYMISIWPKVHATANDYSELKEKGFLYETGKGEEGRAVYDAFSQDARDLYWDQAYEGLFRHGVDAWWGDATEPEIVTWNFEPETTGKYMDNAMGSGYRYLNAYSLVHSKGIYENQRKVSDKRVVNLTRSAFAGQQKYATITWSGDVMGDWESLRKQITAGLNFSVSGLPYWTTDIGGFFVRPVEFWQMDRVDPEFIQDEEYREVYLRWMQWSVFCPVFRSHGTDLPREPWRFGTKDSEDYRNIVKAIKLRYRLIPYIYSLSYSISKDDYTLMRPLFMDFCDQEKVYDIEDQYMFGPSFLVAPILEPYSNGRMVYLPLTRGGWYNFHSGKHFEGNQSIWVETGTDKIPVFVKAGSLLPLGPDVQYSSQKSEKPIELRIYLGDKGFFRFYYDDGETYAYEKGEYATFQVIHDEELRTIEFTALEGDKQQFSNQSFNLVLINPEGSIEHEEKFTYKAKKKILRY